MNSKHLARWLKTILIGVGVCGLIVYSFILPAYGLAMRGLYPEFSNRFWPWLLFLWATAVPCLAALVCAWKIAANIGADRAFVAQNAMYLKTIATLAVGDAAFFFAGNLALLLLNMSHPSVTLASLLVEFVGVAVAVAAAALSCLVQKAAALQEQSDLTI